MCEGLQSRGPDTPAVQAPLGDADGRDGLDDFAVGGQGKPDRRRYRRQRQGKRRQWLLNLGYLVLFTPIMALIMRFYRAAKERSNGIKVGPQRFSHRDIYTDLLTRFDL
ncbi:MAG: hypothetical protein R3D46_07200 [Defluviimonas denitrificans]